MLEYSNVEMIDMQEGRIVHLLSVRNKFVHGFTIKSCDVSSFFESDVAFNKFFQTNNLTYEQIRNALKEENLSFIIYEFKNMSEDARRAFLEDLNNFEILDDIKNKFLYSKSDQIKYEICWLLVMVTEQTDTWTEKMFENGFVSALLLILSNHFAPLVRQAIWLLGNLLGRNGQFIDYSRHYRVINEIIFFANKPSCTSQLFEAVTYYLRRFIFFIEKVPNENFFNNIINLINYGMGPYKPLAIGSLQLLCILLQKKNDPCLKLLNIKIIYNLLEFMDVETPAIQELAWFAIGIFIEFYRDQYINQLQQDVYLHVNKYIKKCNEKTFDNILFVVLTFCNMDEKYYMNGKLCARILRRMSAIASNAGDDTLILFSHFLCFLFSVATSEKTMDLVVDPILECFLHILNCPNRTAIISVLLIIQKIFIMATIYSKSQKVYIHFQRNNIFGIIEKLPQHTDPDIKRLGCKIISMYIDDYHSKYRLGKNGDLYFK